MAKSLSTVANKDIIIDSFDKYLETINGFDDLPNMSDKVLLLMLRTKNFYFVSIDNTAVIKLVKFKLRLKLMKNAFVMKYGKWLNTVITILT